MASIFSKPRWPDHIGRRLGNAGWGLHWASWVKTLPAQTHTAMTIMRKVDAEQQWIVMTPYDYLYEDEQYPEVSST